MLKTENRLKAKACSWVEENKVMLLLCFFSTFIWGLAAHSYMFFNNFPSHDVLNEFYGTVAKDNWKVELGRFVVPLYRNIVRGKLTLPWLIGLLTMLFVAVAVFYTVKIFNIKSKALVILISGIMITNPTVISEIATYLHDTDVNMLALMFSVISVYLWKEYKSVFALAGGAVLLALSLGIYQSYISVTLTFIILSSIISLLDGDSEKQVFVKGLKGIGMIVLGCAVYFAMYALSFKVTGLVPHERTNVLDFGDRTTNIPLYILQLVLNAYYYFKEYITEDRAMLYYDGLMPALAVMILIVAAVIALHVLRRKDFSIAKKLLIAVLAGFMPLTMNITYVTAKGSGIHDLMHYAIWFVYGVLLILAYWIADSAKIKAGNYIKPVCCVLVALMLWSNVRIANTAYLKKDIEFNSELSLMTRLTYQMERVEGYKVGETVVMIDGMTNVYGEVPGTEPLKRLIGLENNSPLVMDNRYGEYFKYVLNYPYIEASKEQIAEVKATEQWQNMPAYPHEDCMQIINGILAVKMGES